MKKIGLFKGVLALFMALQVNAELIKLNVINGDLETGTISGDYNRYSAPNGFEGWKALQGDITHHAQGDGSEGKYLEAENGAIVIGDGVLATVAGDDYVITAGDIITVRFNQNGAGADRYVKPLLYYSANADGSAQTAISTSWEKVGFSGKSFQEGNAFHYEVPAGDPAIGKFLRIAFDGSDGGWARVDNVKVQVERPTAATYTEKSLKLTGGHVSTSIALANGVTKTVTYEAWFKRDSGSIPGDLAGIIMINERGLHINTDGTLGYHWPDGKDWGKHISLSVPENEWSYVALVINGDLATFYVFTESVGWQSHEVVRTHQSQTLTSFVVGAQKADSRVFKGEIDETRFWEIALTEDQLKYNLSRVKPEVDGVKPLVHYNYNEISGTTVPDVSGNGNDGTITGAHDSPVASFSRHNALHFDGGGLKHIALKTPFDILGNWSMEFFIKRYAEPSNITNTQLTFRTGGTGDKLGLRLNTWHKSRRVGMTGSGVDRNFGYYAPVQEWAHYVFVRRGSDLELIVDGVSQGIISGEATDVTVSSIGAEKYDAPWMELAAVRIWDKALTSDEIERFGLEKNDFRPKDLESSSLRLYYDFNHQPGTSVLDLKGNNHGTLVNMSEAGYVSYLPAYTATSPEITTKVLPIVPGEKPSMEVSWGALDGVAEYTLELATNPSFTDVILNPSFEYSSVGDPDPNDNIVVNANSVIVKNLDAGQTYFVRVKARYVRSADVKYDAAYSGYSNIASETFLNPGEFIAVDGDLITNNYEFVAGEFQRFVLTTYQENADLTGPDQLADYTGNATLKLSGFTPAVVGNSGEITVFYIDAQGNVVPGDSKTIVNETVSIGLEFNNGYLQKKVEDPDNPGQFLDYNGKIDLSIYKAGESQNIKMEVEFDTNAEIPTGGKRVFGRDDVTPGYIGAGDFKRWAPLSVRNAMIDSLSFKAGLEPDGMPITVNGGKLEIQPQLEAADAYGNPVVGDSYICTASAPDGEGWHVSGGRVRSVDGSFIFEKLSLINTGDSNRSNPSVTFSVSDGNGGSVSVASTIDGELLNGVGQPGESAVFDGTNYITTASTGGVVEIDGSAGLTYEFWMKATEHIDKAGLVTKYMNGSNNISIFQNGAEAGTLRYEIISAGHEVGKATVKNAYVMNEWTHIALIFDGSLPAEQRTALYSNGVKVGEYKTTLTNVPSLDGVPLLVGKYTNPFVGEMDEVRVWNRALTYSEIVNGSVNPLVGTEDGLVLNYKFDSGINEFIDISTSANHGWRGVNADFSVAKSYAMGCPKTQSATVIKSNGFTANWLRPVSKVNPSAYTIEVALDKEFTFKPIQDVSVDGTSNSYAIEDSSLDPFTPYYYRVTAEYSTGESRQADSVVVATTGDGVAAPGNCLQLGTGSTHVTLSEELLLDGDWSVQTWLKVSESAVDGTMIVVDGEISDLAVEVKTGTDAVPVVTVGVFNGTVFSHKFENVEFLTDEWKNLTFVYSSDSETLSLFVNGVWGASVSFTSTLNVVGISSDSNSLVGQIDEFTVSARAFSQSELREMSYDVKDTNDLATKLYYNFDLLDSSLVPDFSNEQNFGEVKPTVVFNDPDSSSLNTYQLSTAWEVPTAYHATNITADGFTASWEGDSSKTYILELSYDEGFLELIPIVGSEDGNVGAVKERAITGLETGKRVYYRVRYNETGSVFSNHIIAFTSLDTPGNCLKFSAEDGGYVDIPENPLLKGENLNNFTVEAWVMATDANKNGTDGLPSYYGIIGSDSDGLLATAPIIAVTGDTGTDVFFGFSRDHGEDYFATVTGLLETYRWTHLAMTYDGQTIRLYKNGSLAETIENVFSGPSPDKYISYIGKIGGTRTRGAGTQYGSFNGLIDEVRVWNYSRSLAEIVDNYSTEIDSSEQGLSLYYRFNNQNYVGDQVNTDIKSVYDLSSARNDGSYEANVDVNTVLPWKKSYAMVAPIALQPTLITEDGFTANWEAPSFGPVPTKYVLTVYNSTGLKVGGDEIVDGSLSYVVNGLAASRHYYNVYAISEVVDTDNGYGEEIKSVVSNDIDVLLGKLAAPGNAISFDGTDDFITIPQAGSLDFGTENFTIECWVKEDFSKTGSEHIFVCNKKWASQDVGYFMGANRDNGTLRFNFNCGAGSNTYIDGSTVIADGTWHHVAVVIDRENKIGTLYVDGLSDGSAELADFAGDERGDISTNDNIVLGAAVNVDSRTFYRGELDELRFWNSARTAVEIKEAMNDEVFYGSLPTELAAYYQFDEVGSVFDLTSNRHSATMNNFADVALDKVWNESTAMGAVTMLPVSGYTNDSFTVNWQNSVTLEADFFELQVSKDADFSTLVPVAGADSIIASLEAFTVSGLETVVPYFVRVLAKSDKVSSGVRYSNVVVTNVISDASPANALQFDGVDDLVVTSPIYQRGTHALTISAWVYLEDGHTGLAPIYFSQSRPRADQYVAVYINENSEVKLRWANSALKDVKLADGSMLKLEQDEWNHLAVSFYKGGSYVYRSYIDATGAVVTEEATTGHSEESVELYGSSYIGGVLSGIPTPTQGSTDNVGFFKGIIDELQVFNSSLTKADAVSLAQNHPDVNNPVGSSLIHFQLDHAPGEKYAVGVAGLNYGVLYNGDVPKEDETTGPVWVTSGAYFGAPEVTAPTELAEGGFRINWKEVVGADSYTVTLKNTDGSAVVPPPSISIPEKDDLTGEMFVIVSGLNYGPYIYEVVANFPNGGGSSPASVNVATTGFDNAPGYSITGSNSGLSMGNTIFGRAPDEFTVEFWIKPTEFKNHNQLIRMTSGSGGSTSWDGFTFHASEDRSLYVGTTSDDEASRMIISDAFDTGNRNDGVGEVASMPVWQHFAVTYNRGVMTVYKNGVLLASKDGIPASGPWGGLGMTTIDGELDEFRVWSKARTSAEIRETMQTPIAPNSDFLELYYRFDQMEIDPNVGIPDLTGRGLHATLSGFDLNPSYAMVRPVATSVKLIPVGNVDQDGNYEFVTLELSWRDSDILPYPIERLVSGADFDYQTTYIIQSSSDADFSTEASAAITLFSGNLGGGSISRTDDGYKYTLNDASGFDAKFLTTYYFRMTTKDVLKGVPPNGGDEVDDTFGYSSFSNILVSSAVVDAPGNAFTVNKEWPIYVEVDSSDAGQLGDSSFTVETWLNTTVDDKIMPVISTSHLSMENDSGFNIVIDNGKPKLQFGDGTSSDELIGDINIADGFWHHIAFVVDRTTSVVELYVDSVLESTGVVTVAGQVGDGTKLYIGQDASTTYINSFVGALDEIRVWSSARLGSQISKNMIVPVSVDTVPESLIAYYSCDLTSGNIMADIARQKNGVLYGETFNPWRRSAAMGSPQVLPPSEVYGKSFVANWSHANVDLAYLVAEDSDAGTYGYELEVANISSSVEVDDDDYDKLKSVTYKGNDEAASVSYILDSTEQPVSLSDGTAYFYEVTANYDIDGEIHSRKSLVRALSTSVGYFTPPGNSAFFSTSDERYVEINANIALETPDVTVSAWLKPSRPESGASGLGCFVGNRSSETSRYSLSVANDLSYLRIWVNDGASDGYSFPYQLEAEKWQFVTFVMTSSGVKVYVNGILIGEGAISLPEPLGVKLNIGSSNGTKEFFNGSIDEVRIWDHVRTEAQINEFMNFELDGTELAVDEQPYLGGLVAYYKFDNLDQNRILPDMSQNGLDGLVRTSTSGTWGISGALGCPNSLRAIDETKTSFTARWEAPESVIPIPDAADYELQVSNKSTFVNSATDNLQVQGEDGQVLFEVPITRLLASDDERSALLPNRSYYYRVRLEILPGIYRWSEPIVATTEMTAPGYALNFASADYQHVDMGKIAELRGDALPEFTIEAWVKPCRYDFDGSIDTDTNKDISGIVGGNHSYSNEASGAPFIAVVNNTDLQFGFANSFSSAGELIIPDVFTEVRWYHVAFTYKSTVSGGDNEMSIYVDGVNVSKDSGLNTSIAGPPVNNYIQYIGRYSNSVNQGYYDGIIDEVRIWNKWKSETDIRKNMFTQIAPADEVQSDGLVLYYRFNQTDGDVTYDLTTREQPAKLYGFETINSYQYWVKNVGDAIQFGNYSYEDIANDSIEHGVDYITVTLENEDDVVRVELLDINGDVLYEIDTNGSLIYTVSGDQVDNVVSAQTVKYSIGPRDYYVAISNFEVYEEGDRGYIDIKLESEIGVEAIYLIDVEDEKVIVLGVNGSYEYTERFDSYEEALDIDIVVLSKFYTESWNTSFVEFYNDGIIQGDPTLNAASSEVPVDGGLVVELANPGVGPIDTDKDFLVYGQAIAPKDEARFYTMTWGLDDPALASTQVTEQSWYVRNAYTSEGTSINITFDLRELGPGVYGDAPPPIDPETGVPLDPEKIAEYKVNFALSTSEDEDFQLLWSHVILESDTMVYKDLRASYPDIVLELAKDVPLEPGDPDTGVLPIYMTESHEDYYKIRFLGVPAEVVRGGRGYNGNYFALGSSLSLDNFVLTTALGLNAEVKASEDGAEISWTVESEKGVLKYTIQRRDANGDWITVAVVMADGTMSYTVVDSDYVDGAEYRIIASDRYGTTQAFSANGSSEFVTLSKGWNLISLPCADADISELLATASSGLWTWNGLSYEKLNSSPDALQAFWVHSDTEYDVIVEVSGTALTSSSVQLKPGWNLCGPAENCEVPATVEVVYGWQFSAYDEILKVDGEMMKTRGYWIFSTEEEVISLP